MTWATAVTILRIALIPLFVVFMFRDGGDPADPATSVGSYLAFIVFAVAALSDSLDGYLARRHGAITPLGQFLDPLADKLLVGAALVTLVILREFPAWAAAVIAIREIAVSALRSLAIRRGRSVPASALGKAKTMVQIPTVLLWLLPRDGSLVLVQDAAVWIAVALTLISGAQYFRRAGDLLAKREDARS